MNFDLSDEQRLLREAAADALGRIPTIESARAAHDGAKLPDLWPTACEAGWTGLLVAEEHGGAGLDVFDAMLVLEECGRRLTGAGLIGHLIATRLLNSAAEAGDKTAAAVLPALATGDERAAIVLARPPRTPGDMWSVDLDGPGPGSLPTAALGHADGEVLVSGVAGRQIDAAGADLFVVPVELDDGELGVVLVRSTAAGLDVQDTTRGDASRPIASVELDQAPGRPLFVPGVPVSLLRDAWDVAQALLGADALGVSEAVLDMAVVYAKERQTFGRPIGSYQAIKHQLVEILRHVETTRNLCYYVGYAAEARPEDLSLAAACARFAGENASTYATRTCIAVHGGIGATWEHDAPFYWRRAQLSRLLAGGVTGAGDGVATQIVEITRAPAAA